jgi:hypothetical protein
MRQFMVGARRINKDCPNFKIIKDEFFCDNEEIDEALSEVEGEPKIMTCEGCFNAGRRSMKSSNDNDSSLYNKDYLTKKTRKSMGILKNKKKKKKAKSGSKKFKKRK